MRKLVLAAGLSALSAFGFVYSYLSVAAADDVKAVAIVKNADGKFVFSDTNAKIKEGQTIKWVAVDSDVPHQLVPDSEGDALTDTRSSRAPAPSTIIARFIPRACGGRSPSPRRRPLPGQRALPSRRRSPRCRQKSRRKWPPLRGSGRPSPRTGTGIN
jgi:plastocyanin